MPSPFPGMDPFLENPRYFPGLHSSLVFVTYEDLQKKLPEPFFAVLNERLWVEASERHIEPDIDLLRGKTTRRATKNGAGGLALLTRSKPIHIPIADDERRETFIEIRAGGEGEERLVTTIEVLSITNKTRGTKRRDAYLRKQEEILDGNTNLVEIDLLRGGRHTTAVSLATLRHEVKALDYHVCVYAHERDWWVHPIHLEEPLPEIAVPLTPEVRAVPLDLQAIFDRCYNAGPFKRRVKYDVRQVVPPLSAKQARWARERLRDAKVSR